MRKLQWLAVGGLCVVNIAWSMNTGYYVGIGVGQDDMNLDSASATVNGTLVNMHAKSTPHLTAKFLYGYMTQPGFGVELGFAHYASEHWAVTEDGVSAPAASLRADALGLSLRFDWMLTQAWDVVVKPGIAWVRTHSDSHSSVYHLNETEGFVRPEIAVGSSYTLNRAWTIEAMLDEIVGRGDAQDAITHSDSGRYLPGLFLFTVGVDYSF